MPDQRGSATAGSLPAQLEAAKRHVKGLQTALRQPPRYVRVGELSAQQRPQPLAEPLRMLLNAIRGTECGSPHARLFEEGGPVTPPSTRQMPSIWIEVTSSNGRQT